MFSIWKIINHDEEAMGTPHRGRMSNQFLKENPLISKAAGFGEDLRTSL